jgi:hypothetical protein
MTNAEHPAVTIMRGDTVGSVQSKLKLSAAPTPMAPEDGKGSFYHLDDLGFWVFFDDNGHVYSLRYDANFPYAIEGIKMGDSRDAVQKARGKRDRLHSVQDKERWIYDKPRFLRVDFDPTNSRVERIFR